MVPSQRYSQMDTRRKRSRSSSQSEAPERTRPRRRVTLAPALASSTSDTPRRPRRKGTADAPARHVKQGKFVQADMREVRVLGVGGTRVCAIGGPKCKCGELHIHVLNARERMSNHYPGDGPHTCKWPNCTLPVTGSRFLVLRHTEQKHLRWWYQCPDCRKRFQRWDLLMKHWSRVAGRNGHMTRRQIRTWLERRKAQRPPEPNDGEQQAQVADSAPNSLTVPPEGPSLLEEPSLPEGPSLPEAPALPEGPTLPEGPSVPEFKPALPELPSLPRPTFYPGITPGTLPMPQEFNDLPMTDPFNFKLDKMDGQWPFDLPEGSLSASDSSEYYAYEDFCLGSDWSA